MRNRTLKTVTLGCKVNQYETEYLREGLALLGYREADEGETADLCIVNTCTVTAESDRKSRKTIRHLAKENPGAEIIVMGCYATRSPHEAGALPGVVEVVTDKRELPALLERLGLVNPPSGISTFGRRHRAYVKIQDGCRMNCSYCIIPKTRPLLTSRRPLDVLDEIRRLVANQYREIVLTGIHLGHYGVDLDGGKSNNSALHAQSEAKGVVDMTCKQTFTPFASLRACHTGNFQTNSDLAGLLREIAQLEGEFRVRISSIEAAEATPDLLEVMAAHPRRICPHLHLSMQSGSDTVLERMRRRYTSAEFVDRCRRVTDSLDNPALTTDVIVGFPGETEAEFEQTCRTVEEIGFSKIHIFRFSPREGTVAASMPNRVPGNVQRERSERLAALAGPLREAFFQSLVGRKLQVLIESAMGNDGGDLLDIDGASLTHPTGSGIGLLGTSARYAPVQLSHKIGKPGDLVEVTAERVVDGGIVGE